MLYQCFHAREYLEQPPFSPLYRPFGLLPELNPALTRNCPELADAKICDQLSEFTAMLHLWRNREARDESWIGFTSCRQMRKTPFVFQAQDQSAIEDGLKSHDILGWGHHSF